ncbi:hypothetical protein EMCRGX_G022325 [Ephydatia muelleri]|eukprot:Em0009g1073a
MASSDTLGRLLAVADKTSGRDNLCRLLQYASKFLSWALERRTSGLELAAKLKQLEASISTARKLFRLGKSADHLRGALQTLHLTDVVLRVLITLNKLNRALYLLLDNLLWAAKMNLIKIDAERWTTWAMKFWLLAIVLGLTRDLYELYITTKTVQRATVSSGEQPSLHSAAMEALCRNPPLALDLVKNAADVFLPSAKLELLHVSGGVVGIMGMVSSLASLVSIWNDRWKLKYS